MKCLTQLNVGRTERSEFRLVEWAQKCRNSLTLGPAYVISTQNLLHHMSMNIRQTTIDAVLSEGQLCVVDTHQM